MDVELTIEERLVLLGLLPERGNLATLRIVQNLHQDLSFTEDEIEAYSLEITENERGGTRVNWDRSKEKPRAYDFGATATQTIIDTLQKLDKDGKVELRHLSLMDKFGFGE